jgi:hypothetical protein
VTLDPDVQAFADSLHEVEAILSEHNQQHWAMKVARSLAIVERSDACGIRCFLSLFGGMGSLNDLVLSRDGQFLKAENDRLGTLLGRAQEAGRRLERNEERPEGAAGA